MSYPGNCIRTITRSSLWPDLLQLRVFLFMTDNLLINVHTELSIDVQHVASDLIVTARQYHSGEFGLIPELHPQLRKRQLLWRGAQRHQRRLPSRCNRLSPGSESMHWERPGPARCESPVICARLLEVMLTATTDSARMRIISIPAGTAILPRALSTSRHGSSALVIQTQVSLSGCRKTLVRVP